MILKKENLNEEFYKSIGFKRLKNAKITLIILLGFISSLFTLNFTWNEFKNSLEGHSGNVKTINTNTGSHFHEVQENN